MKKIVFSIVALIALAFSASAQDTVDFRDGHHVQGYFYDSKYDSCISFHTMSALGGPDGKNAEWAKRFVCDSDLVVYGIAAAILDPKKYWGTAGYCRIVHDTSTALAYDYLRIYPAGRDTLAYIDQVKVHLRVNPVAYHAIFDDVADSVHSFIADVYERYFNAPVNVTDSFYMGMTFSHNIPYVDSATSTRWSCESTNLMLCGIRNYNPNTIENTLWYHHEEWHRYEFPGHCYLLFPLLMPAPVDYQWDTIPMAGGDTIIGSSDTILAGDTIIIRDTAIVSDTVVVGYDTIVVYDTIILGDTILGIDDHGMLGRLTGVMPNPAAETAKVVSSFGLSRVEAYNLAGEKVDDLRLPSPSLSATLDLRRWPVGAYILRIHTPQGVATKKLTVVR